MDYNFIFVGIGQTQASQRQNNRKANVMECEPASSSRSLVSCRVIANRD